MLCFIKLSFEIFSLFSMKKFVLVPFRTFVDICSQVKRQGDTVTGVIKNFKEDEPPKPKSKKEYVFLKFCHN